MRYRMLWDVSSADSKACGLVIDRGEFVEIIAPAEMGFPTRLSEPMRVLDYDRLSDYEIFPGHERYFDECCMHLSRSFALTGDFDAQNDASPAETGPTRKHDSRSDEPIGRP